MSLIEDQRYHCKRTYCSSKCQLLDPALSLRLVSMNAKLQTIKQTSVEKIGYELLDSLHIKYSPQSVINNKICVDALCEGKLVVQFDGDYWHGNPKFFRSFDKRQSKRMAFDKSQDAYLTKCGYRILRFWENDLKKNLDECKKILNYQNQPCR